MTAKEILEKLPQLYEDVSSFAHCENPKTPEGFIFSSELTELIVKKDAAWGKLLAHPGWNKRELKDEEYTRLEEVYREIENYEGKCEKEILDSFGIGEYKEVERYGGEGKGETWYSIKHFTKHDVYIKTDGHYTSHYGTDFDYGWGEEVKPQQRTVTVFETIK